MSRFINVEKEKNQKIIRDLIDKENYLGLYKDRGKLIEVGVALGKDEPKKLKTKESLYREEYIKQNPEIEAIITCAAVGNIDTTGDINDLLSADAIYAIADQCLNAGLDVLENNINNKPLNNYKLKLLEELDELYEENVKPVKRK